MKIFLKWSNWIDLSTGHFEHKPYLLQGRRRSDGKVQFRVSTTFRICWYASKIDLTDLEKLVNPANNPLSKPK